MNDKVFLCSLTHDGKLDYRMAGVFFNAARRPPGQWDTFVKPSSLLASTCNEFWAKAINEGYEWFAMLHADIVPEAFYLDKLISLAIEHKADIMSAVVPIKGPQGTTSTAISGPNPFQRATRLMTREIYQNRFPKTFDCQGAIEGLASLGHEIIRFDDQHLLVNTGCMVAKLGSDWCRQAYFTIRNQMVTGAEGVLSEMVEPEDWFFSRMASQAGARVMATTEVHLEHIGNWSYHSHQVWGHPVDPVGFVTIKP